MAEIKDILSELRQDRSLTQAELAKIFHISSSSISAYELGTRLPTIEVLLEYVKTFDVSSDYILGLSPYNDTLSSLHQEVFDGKTVSDVIDDIQALTSEQKKVLLTIIKYMRFYAEVAEKAENASGTKK